MPSQRPAGDTQRWGQGVRGPPGHFRLPLVTLTHDSHSDYKGQNDAQREADDIVCDCIHNGPEGLLAGPSQDSAVDALQGGRREGREVGVRPAAGLLQGVPSKPFLLQGLLSLSPGTVLSSPPVGRPSQGKSLRSSTVFWTPLQAPPPFTSTP